MKAKLLNKTSSSREENGERDVSAVFALTLSVVSSVSLVIVNKHLISILGFKEGTSSIGRGRGRWNVSGKNSESGARRESLEPRALCFARLTTGETIYASKQ